MQIGKGWIAYLFKDRNVPMGELVRTKDGILVKTRPDYMFKHVYVFREYEPVNTAIFRRIVKPNDLCLDVGANFGYYSCLFAHWGAQVYSFEPVPATFALNQETVQLNHLEASVRSLNCALGETPGSFRIFEFKELSHGHSSSCDLGRPDAVAHDCQVITLDGFCAEHGIDKIAFIKIDVEGFEYEVLKGGRVMLGKPDAPTLHFEVNGECMRHRKMDPNQIIGFLRDCGYTEFLQIGRYGGVKKAPDMLPLTNYDYLAFKDRDLAARVLRG
jgi:FkbM family methyltransferase